jgi:hypothetical protein
VKKIREWHRQLCLHLHVGRDLLKLTSVSRPVCSNGTDKTLDLRAPDVVDFDRDERLTRFAGLSTTRLGLLLSCAGESWGIMLDRLRTFSPLWDPIPDRRLLLLDAFGVDETRWLPERFPEVFLIGPSSRAGSLLSLSVRG